MDRSTTQASVAKTTQPTGVEWSVQARFSGLRDQEIIVVKSNLFEVYYVALDKSTDKPVCPFWVSYLQ
jgi:hypothetical protein